MSKISEREINSLKDILKEKGYKLTTQRRAVLDTIIDNEGRHLTVEEIYDMVKKECPEIGIATVYRTIQLFEDAGKIAKVDLSDGYNRYELIHDYESHQHHHLICKRCGKVIEVQEDLLGQLESEIEEKYSFKVTNHSAIFYGLCSECINKS